MYRDREVSAISATNRGSLDGRFSPAINRLRAIAADAGDALLTEGPVQPDHKLLDLCAEALHVLVHAERAWVARPKWVGESDQKKRDAMLTLDKELMEAWETGNKAAKPKMVAIAKIKATTPAGIYAKAMVVRASKTGAAGLAMSLAEDLVACDALRASLWPASGG
jgi:hypothetical protein